MVLMNTRILLVLASLSFISCDMEQTSKSRGPIVLGDSATIVTESDPMALQDQVPDLKPVITTEPEPDPATASSGPDTAVQAPAKPVVTPAPAPSGNGLTVAFKEVTLFLPGITTRSYSKADLQKARSATYELTGGNLTKSKLQATGGTITKLSQQYETVALLKHENQYLPLESLGKYASGWQNVAGSGGSYPITGLDAGKLQFRQTSANSIRNAIQAAARKARLSRKETQDLLQRTRNLRSASQAPASVALRSVSWRIQGKDAGGKAFNKELRIDVPLP